MSYHKLLEKQIKKHLKDIPTDNSEFEKFIAAVNDSYFEFDRDRDLWTNAFSLSEREYKEVNENLGREWNLKKLSLDKLKEALKEIDENNELNIADDSDDLLGIVTYLKKQIIAKKEVEENLAKTAQILTTLVSNLNSGILLEDEYRKIQYINQTFCNMFEIPTPPDVLVGADCSKSAQQSKHLFKAPDAFVTRINLILKEKKRVIGDELELIDGRFFERNYIPLFLGTVYKGHQWQYTDISERKYQELRLKENQEELQRLSLVASANTNGVLLTDSTGRIFWSNEGYLNLTGYSMPDLIGKRPIDVARGPLSDGGQIRNMIRAYALGKSFTIELSYYRKDNTWFWGRVKGQPILDENNKILQYFSIIEDISIEKDREEQIQRLSLVASANSKGVFILNNNLTLAWVNSAYENITGYKNDELLNKNPIQLFATQGTDPLVFKRMREKDELSEDFTEEFIHGKKDGSTFWARLNVQFVRSEEGDLVQRFGVLEDITKEKDAEHAILVREEKYRSIIANMNLGLLEVDNEDKIQFANQSFLEMSGYESEELVGKKAAELFITGKNIETIKVKNERRKKGESDAYELPIRNKRGELKYWLISGAPRFNDHGQVIGSIGIHLDITKQKLQEKELIEARQKAEESSEAKEVFLANMSHEIRTPLNAIIGMLRELSKETVNNKQKAYLNNADTASRHLLSIINNILDMSKIEAGEFQLDNSHFSLRDVINETVSIISSNAAEKLIQLDVNISEKLKPALIGDPVRLRQILINILGNSIKFTEKGYISINCQVKNTSDYLQQIQISISDTGIGMDKTFLKTLFKKFSQEDKSTARKYGGTGLGMAITYELVHLMGGKIEITSEKNKGTRVELTLPLAIGDTNELETISITNSFSDLKGLKVLLAEDNELNRMVAINTLSHFGLETTEAENGAIAIEKMRTQHFDVVLMDLHMPEIDGLEATRIIRKEIDSTIPIIALTANAFKKEIDQCLEAGMNDYVTKPFEESLLLQTILKHLFHKKIPLKVEGGMAGSESIQETKLYDLSSLIDISRGDDEFIKKMIGLFIDQATLSIQQIKNAFTSQDFKSLGETAHRIKASVGNLGIAVLKQDITDMEHLAFENPFSERLPLLIESTEKVLGNVVEQLKKEL